MLTQESDESEGVSEIVVEKPFSSNLEKAKEKLAELEILENIEGFRDDLEEIYVEEVTVEADIDDKRRWGMAGKQALEDHGRIFRRIEGSLDFVKITQLIVSFLSLFVSYPVFTKIGVPNLYAGVLSIIVGILVFFIEIGLPYTQVVINQTGYRNFIYRREPERIRFQAGWNRGVLHSNIAFSGIIIAAILRSQMKNGYDRGLNFIRHYLRFRD